MLDSHICFCTLLFWTRIAGISEKNLAPYRSVVGRRRTWEVPTAPWCSELFEVGGGGLKKGWDCHLTPVR